MTLPRVLARLPYGANTKPIEEFGFEEVELGPEGEPIGVDHDDYCWMNAAFVLGAKLTDAYAKTSWCTAIRGKEGGGLVEDLPAHIFKSADGDLDLKCPTEIPIDDRREYEISKLGFLSLGHYDAQINRMAQTYRQRRAVMEKAITEQGLVMAGTDTFGGSSIWMKAPEGVNTVDLALTLRKRGVLIEPGQVFFAPGAQNNRFYRLAYSSIPTRRIAEGISRIAAALP